MSTLYTIVLLSALSQTFAQSFFRSNKQFNIIQPTAFEQSNRPISSPDETYSGGELEVTDLNSPYLSEFAAYNLQVQKQYGIYPRLFEYKFSPNVVKENFYNEAVYFALENEVYDIGSLPQQFADAGTQAYPHLTPLEYFKVVSNTLELILQRAGLGDRSNYQVLTRLNAKAIRDAMEKLNVDNAEKALHAVIVGGAGRFLRSINFNSPDDIRFSIAAFADQFAKVPTTSGLQ